MTKKERIHRPIPQGELLSATDAADLLGIGRTRFWQLRKEFDLRRISWSPETRPLYRREDVMKLVAVPQSGQVEPAPVAPVEVARTAPQAEDRVLPMTQSNDPSEVFAVDYYDSYLVPEHLRHLTVAEFRELKDPLAKPKPPSDK